MNKLIEIQNMGFRVSWKLIEIGLCGYSYIAQQLSKDDVYEYCNERLLQEDEETDNCIKLICQVDNDGFTKTLHDLARNENSNVQLQLRKWRAFLLAETLESVGEDYFQGLLELTEFWASVDFPSDSPHLYQTESTQEYYTQAMYDTLAEKNQLWVKDEIELIISQEKTVIQT